MKRDMTVPITKVPARLPRVRCGSKRFIISAIGGPPMEVEVPRNPEVRPARTVLRLVGSGLQPRLERDIAKSTAQPMKMERPSCERDAIAHAPANEPGM